MRCNASVPPFPRPRIKVGYRGRRKPARMTVAELPTERGEGVESDLQAIRDMVSEATVLAKVQQSVLNSFDEMPKLYRELGRTYESRFSDRIVGLVDGMIRSLASKDAGAGAPALSEAIVNQLRAMHDRHGIAVALKVRPPAAKPKPAAQEKGRGGEMKLRPVACGVACRKRLNRSRGCAADPQTGPRPCMNVK